MNRTRRLTIAGGAVALVLLTVGLARQLLSPLPPAHPLQAIPLDRGTIEKTVIASATLKPAMQVEVGAQVNGQLRKLYVRQGDRVRKGQLLAEIDPTLQESELNTAQARLASASAQKRASQATLQRDRLAYQRQRQMMRDGAGVQSDLEVARARYAAQQAQMAVDDAQIVQAQMAVKTAQANLSYTRIVAPIDGEVLGIVTREGQTIVSSQSAPTILVLANLEQMRVETRISEADIQKIHAGQPLEFYVIANPERRYRATMGYVQPAPPEALTETGNRWGSGGPASSAAVYYTGSFDVANRDRLLKTAMTAQVLIRIAHADGALRIPLNALGEPLGADRYAVMVAVNGQPQRRVLQTGLRDRQYAEVISGLQEGDRVLVASAQGEE
ncbi:efflux RND transporter periplasmic adaptor subunit [Pantoea sp. 1.19]|uniref:efflux RND transporter periplasmic adaptor subunit n=1 Tax=Pantoea sp. 1.19 TaxID=1925589 RepID=UPI000948A8E7|nr:efflux RND transporter periplasmic adaptor subunit [Pantoea sp. 1.19]